MVIISKTKLVSFYEGENKAKEPLLKWYYKRYELTGQILVR